MNHVFQNREECDHLWFSLGPYYSVNDCEHRMLISLSHTRNLFHFLVTLMIFFCFPHFPVKRKQLISYKEKKGFQGRLVFFFSFEMGFHSFALIAQARVQWHDLGSLQPPTDFPASASQVAGITGMHHHTWLILYFQQRWGFSMLVRLVSNWAQAICLPQPSTVLRLPSLLFKILFIYRLVILR